MPNPVTPEGRARECRCECHRERATHCAKCFPLPPESLSELERAMKWLTSAEGQATWIRAYETTACLSSPWPWRSKLLAAYAAHCSAEDAQRIKELEAEVAALRARAKEPR